MSWGENGAYEAHAALLENGIERVFGRDNNGHAGEVTELMRKLVAAVCCAAGNRATVC